MAAVSLCPLDWLAGESDFLAARPWVLTGGKRRGIARVPAFCCCPTEATPRSGRRLERGGVLNWVPGLNISVRAPARHRLTPPRRAVTVDMHIRRCLISKAASVTMGHPTWGRRPRAFHEAEDRRLST